MLTFLINSFNEPQKYIFYQHIKIKTKIFFTQSQQVDRQTPSLPIYILGLQRASFTPKSWVTFRLKTNK